MFLKRKPALVGLIVAAFSGLLLTSLFFLAFNPAQAATNGSGTGLAAAYYNNRTLSGTPLNRTDATVNFNWGTAAPLAGVGSDNFSVRWTGYVQPRYSESYTFYTTSDDGVRLWVNNQLVINNWTDHAAREDKGTLTLSAGQQYQIKMEFYENGGSAVAKLAWSSQSQLKEIVPQSQLYPALSQPAPTATATPVVPTATPTPALPTATPTATPDPATLDSEEAAFLTLINQYRQSKGLPPLTLNTTLTTASKWMSQDMANKNYFSHTDSLGRDPFTRMAAFGYTANTYKAENIAAGYSTAASVMTGWQNSSGHNANMLNPNYKVIGIGRAYNANSTYKWYWTTDFGGQ
jgi:uncharacterized protein YkwD